MMDNWKLQLLVVTFCVLLQTSAGWTGSSGEERRPSRYRQYESEDRGVSGAVDGLEKRAKALRFYGLMGKRAETKKPFPVKRRNKGEAFVGLMGRRASSEESLSEGLPSATTRGTPHSKGSLKEWIRILY